jgi:hypothetical protein
MGLVKSVAVGVHLTTARAYLAGTGPFQHRIAINRRIPPNSAESLGTHPGPRLRTPNRSSVVDGQRAPMSAFHRSICRAATASRRTAPRRIGTVPVSGPLVTRRGVRDDEARRKLA